MFGSLMNLFAENIGTVDPDVSLSVEQLCNAYCLLFGVKGHRDRTIVKNYEDSSDEEERAAEYVLREVLQENEMVETNHDHEQIVLQSRGRELQHLECLGEGRFSVCKRQFNFWVASRLRLSNMLVKDIVAAISISIVGVAQHRVFLTCVL